MKTKYYNNFTFGFSVFNSLFDTESVRVRLFPSSRMSADITLDYDDYIKLKIDIDEVLCKHINEYNFLKENNNV